MPKILVVSDIHQDDRALETILRCSADYDQIWFLGDVVGHGDHVKHKYPDYEGNAQVCYEMLQHHKAQCIIWNWEYWLLNPEKDKEKDSNQYPYRDELTIAREGLKRKGLLDWISSWKQDIPISPFTLVHGSVDRYNGPGSEADHPSEVYLMPEELDIVKRVFLYKKTSTPHMLFGHTHIPGYFTYNGHFYPEWHDIKKSDLDVSHPYKLEMISRVVHFVINPGSANLNRNKDSKGYWSDVYGTILEINTDEHTFTYRPVIVD